MNDYHVNRLHLFATFVRIKPTAPFRKLMIETKICNKTHPMPVDMNDPDKYLWIHEDTEVVVDNDRFVTYKCFCCNLVFTVDFGS